MKNNRLFATLSLILAVKLVASAQNSYHYENLAEPIEVSMPDRCNLRELWGDEQLFVGDYKYYVENRIEGDLRDALMNFNNIILWDSAFDCSSNRIKEFGVSCDSLRRLQVEYSLRSHRIYLFECLYIDESLTGLLVGTTGLDWGGASQTMFMIVLKEGCLVSSTLVSLDVFSHDGNEDHDWQVKCNPYYLRQFELLVTGHEPKLYGRFNILEDGTVQEITK